MTRTGKIARLPRNVRDQLNHRLDDGEPGPQLLAWLNERRDVRETLERDFGGRPVTEQNLSEWRQGGWRDWQRQQEACDHVRRLTEQAEAVDEAAEETNVSDRLASVFAVELFKVLEQLLTKTGDDREKLGLLREGLREIRLLRRGDHSASRLQMELERWEHQRVQSDEEREEELEQARKKRLIHLLLARHNEGDSAKIFGGGEYGRKMAELINNIKFDLPCDDLANRKETGTSTNGSTKLDQAESDRIKANPTKSDQEGVGQ